MLLTGGNYSILKLMESFLIKHILSSTYLLQQTRCSDKVWINLFSNSTKNICNNTVPNDKTIVIPLNFFIMFESFNIHHRNRFLTNVVNKAYTYFIL